MVELSAETFGVPTLIWRRKPAANATANAFPLLYTVGIFKDVPSPNVLRSTSVVERSGLGVPNERIERMGSFGAAQFPEFDTPHEKPDTQGRI